MAYLYSERLNPVDQWRGVIERQLDLLRRTAHEIFWTGEKGEWFVEADGLGVWGKVDSTWSPEPLLKSIKEKAFPSFGFLAVHSHDTSYPPPFPTLPHLTLTTSHSPP